MKTILLVLGLGFEVRRVAAARTIACLLPPMGMLTIVRPPASDSRWNKSNIDHVNMVYSLKIERHDAKHFTMFYKVMFVFGMAALPQLLPFSCVCQKRKRQQERNEKMVRATQQCHSIWMCAAACGMPNAEEWRKCAQRMEIELKFHPIASVLSDFLFMFYCRVRFICLSVNLYVGCCAPESASVFISFHNVYNRLEISSRVVKINSFSSDCVCAQLLAAA